MTPKRQATSSRRARDRAAILLLLGILLLVSPMAGIFSLDMKIGGIPFTLIYLFSVWAGLILAARYLARQLQVADGGGAEDGQGRSE